MGSDSSRRNILVALAVAGAIAHAQAAHAQTAQLPVPCVAGGCGASAPGFVTSGSATAVQSGNNLTVNQTSANTTLNWRSFNVSRDGSVVFRQPDANSVALNRIFQNSPSQILGSLTANGRVFLINQNGIVFGEGAQVNVGGLLASTLDMTPEAAELGIAQASTVSAAAFTAFRDADGNKLQSAPVTIEAGAQINAPGGQVLVFAPEVANRGTIRTPDGQTMLAAGESIYLAFPGENSGLRGLLVEIDTGDTASGVVTNGAAANAGQTNPALLAGQILAERGNVTLAGLVVNQQGRISATTSVRSNGSIRLLARDGGAAPASGGLTATRGGTLTLGANSSTTVTLDRNDQDRTVDVNVQPRSRVELEGGQVRVLENARVVATSGSISALAIVNATLDPTTLSAVPDESRLYIAPGAHLDVSGATVDLPVERNVIAVELRGSQLADSPLQRDGELRSERVRVDIRTTGTRPDGSTWIGTPLADVSGDISTISRTVQERSLTGGTIELRSQGDVILSQGATLDLSGGHINFQDGFIQTSQLLGADGRVYSMAQADPARQYTRILNGAVVQHERWGVTQNFGESPGRFELGYIEGKDAGSLTAYAPNLVLDGVVRAETLVGPYQRQAPLALPAGSVYRSHNQRPLGGEIVLGNISGPLNSNSQPNYILPDVEVENGAVLPGIPVLGGGLFDPLDDPMPVLGSVRLRPEMLEDGVTRVRVVANGTWTLPESSTLDLGVFGSLDVIAGSAVLAGNVVAPAGTVRITARETAAALELSAPAPLEVASSAHIDVAGRWINDDALLNPQGAHTPLALNGGTVTLNGGNVLAAAGSVIDAGGGAWRRADGSLSYGSGGRISITATGAGLPEVPLVLEGDLSAFAFSRGGSLTLNAPSMCLSAVACSGPEGTFRISQEWLTDRGFENLSFESTDEDLIVEPDSVFQVRQRNLAFTGAVREVESGQRLDTIARVETLPDQQRRPANLTLTARPAGALLTQTYSSETLQEAPELIVSENSSFTLDTRASVNLNSSARIRLDGSISAPGGTITANLDASLSLTEFIGSQGIWLGERARLDVAGVPRITLGSTGLRAGEVLDGGRVSLTANRGSLMLAPGSVIDVSGTSAELDLPVGGIGSGRTQPTQVASSGGTIQLTAAEGIFANSTLRAASGDPGHVEGGSISITLDTANRGVDPVQNLYPGESRRIELYETLAPVVYEYGSAPSLTLNGRALLSAAVLRESGADSISLNARNVRGIINEADTVRSAGRVVFNGNVELAPRARLNIDAPILESTGGRARLSSAYVSLGHGDIANQSLIGTSVGGVGELEVRAGLIDLLGQSYATGFDHVQLDSDGDLRLRGVQGIGALAMPGAFTTAGRLELTAQQIYPTTYSTFTLQALAADADGRGEIVIEQAPGAAGDVYSAGGNLTLRADLIESRGTLRAPFGTLSLDADDIVLESGSVVSTSAQGLVIPFGNTQGGFDWTYTLPFGQTIDFGPNGTALPAQRVSLNGERIDFRAGATIDVSGGGDMQAWEFVPGPTGTRDILGNAIRPNQFAILPAASLTFAAFDAAESGNFSALPGESIEIPVGVPGIAAGTYALLPARYALLPGAMLVSAVSGYTDIAPGQSFTRLDGSVVIAGRRTVAGTELGDARFSGFAIQPGRFAQLEARYDLSRASEFFAREQATDATGLRLPGDAGSLTLTPREELNLSGSLNATGAGIGARGVAVELAAERLRIVNAPLLPVAGEVAVLAGDLERLRPESLVLGARLLPGEDSTTIDVVSNSIDIDGGVQLSAPELLIAALDTVHISQGAHLSNAGTSGAATRFTVDGDAVLLHMTNAPSLEQFERVATTGATGSLLLDEGATLSTGGSLRLDASRDMELGGTLDLDDAALALGAPAIALGAAPVEYQGLVLGTAQLADINFSELELSSRQLLDVFGPMSLEAQELRLRLPGIRAASDDAGLSIQTTRLSIENPFEAVETVATGSGQLTIAAGGIELDEGSFALSGFENSELRVAGDVVAVGDGEVRSAGALTVGANRITGEDGVSYRFNSEGALRLGSAPTDSTLDPLAVNSGLGARLSFSGSSLDIDTEIAARAGRVSFEAQHDVNFGANARLELAGVSVTFDDVPVAAPGGHARVVSHEGDVTMAQGSRIDVSGVDGGRAGGIDIFATRGIADLSGALLGATRDPGRGGEFQLDAHHVANFGGLITQLGTGGFDSSVDIRQRGAGNLVLAAGSTLRAQQVRLAADSGALEVGGTIDARGEAGGSISLFAQDSVALSGRLLASAETATGRGGRVQLGSETGGVNLSPGSLIDVSAGSAAGEIAAGSVELRVSRNALAQLLDGVAGNDSTRIAGTVRGHRLMTLEGFEVRNDADGRILANETQASAANPIYSAATSFMNQAGALETALGRAIDERFEIRPGIEIRSAGDLAVAADWNLALWRFDGAPGVLTLRAGDDLRFDRSLSDGFDSVSTTALLTATTDSWSYRLVSGADFNASDPLGLRDVLDMTDRTGNFDIAAGTTAAPRVVRTGTGSIDVAAAGNIRFGSQASVLYTAGIVGEGIRLGGNGGLGDRAYPIRGGDISLRASGDIVGAQSNQLFTEWLWRTGRAESFGVQNPQSTGWTVNYNRFEQGVAALGGGNLSIRAEGDIDKLSASIPSIGRQLGGTRPEENQVEVDGGGNLDVRAGGSILGGAFYVGLGNAYLQAGDHISRGSSPLPDGGYLPVFALGDAGVEVVARGDLGIGGITNPTLLPRGRSQGLQPQTASFFSTYGEDSRIAYTSVGGNVEINIPEEAEHQGGGLLSLLGGSMQVPRQLFQLRLAPPVVRVSSLSGDIDLLSNLTLMPDPRGNLDLFARDNLRLGGARPTHLIISDADPAQVPGIDNPSRNFTTDFGRLVADLTTARAVREFNAENPVHGIVMGGGAADPQRSRLIAADGDVIAASDIYSAEPLLISAGRDVLNLSFTAQNTSPSSVTSVIAGRDVTYPLVRNEGSGTLRTSVSEMRVAGPGEFMIAAGRHVDLQTSSGITTLGNTTNPGLSEGGANVSITAGLAGRQPDYAGFTQRYLVAGTAYDLALREYVLRVTGEELTSGQAAEARFATLPLELRVAFLEQVLLAELRAGGRSAAAPGPGFEDYSRAFDALATFYPGSNPNLDAGEVNPYSGDIRLFFSRVYTLDGGSISLFAPGGEINAGLAAPPVAFGITKAASELGVVVQSAGNVSAVSFGDLQVNESRVFAADGGDILVWSTRGDIDAGRGAKTAISAPAPTITFDENGQLQVNFPAALTGSGIQTLATSAGREPGDVDLYAPRGVVNAGDAGIVAGNLTIGATAVLGANNISVTGVSVGVPVDAGGIAVGFSGVSNVASGSSNAAAGVVEQGGQAEKPAPLASAALSWLEVFVEGFGDEVCKAEDAECLARQRDK